MRILCGMLLSLFAWNSIIDGVARAQPAQADLVPLAIDRGDGQAPVLAMMSTQDASNPISLSKLVLAKLERNEDGLRLVCMVEQYRMEERTANVMQFRTEDRVRTVTVERDGKPEEVVQRYTVKVPFQTTRTATVRVPAGKKPKAISAEKIRVFRLDASPVSLEEAAKLLQTLQPIFLHLDTQDGQELEPASALVRQVVNPSVLIVQTSLDALR